MTPSPCLVSALPYFEAGIKQGGQVSSAQFSFFPPFVLVMSVEKSSFHPLGARKKSISGKLPSRFNLSRFAYVEVSLTYMPHIKKKCNQLDPSYRVCDLHSPFMFLFGCFVQVVPSFALCILFLITFFLTISGYNNFLLSIFNSLRNKIPRTA